MSSEVKNQEQTGQEQNMPSTAEDNGRDRDGMPADGETASSAHLSAPMAEAEPGDDTDETAQATIDDAERVIQLEAELAEANARADDYYEQMQRIAADFQNTRRRQERQLSDSIQRASERIVVRLLPILDDLDLAFQNVPASLGSEENAWVDGFRQIQRKLLAVLEEEGVSPMAPEGEFDPNCHEAISHEPNADVESGHIIATLRTGYHLNSRVLRPALVRVAQ
jgi:molecular chaperone GrpE